MLKPGTFISDRYEIIDKVGSGGMADVYKARDQRLNRFVAIKILKTEYSSDKSFVNKFRGEAQSAAGLSHPNIVNVYDVGDDSGLHYIVMELVEGITLKRFIERKGKLEVKEAVGIAIQIAQGMEAAHDNHIIHRDIKPQNIIISRDGKVKVTDFGIAKATNSNTITSNAMGSVHYLSPEQARGGYSDEKSDIYSLGVTIYEMLSGKVPFAGDNTVSVALLHIQAEAMPLRELDPLIPVSVDKIVQKCMQKKAERRYHSASELISDLKKAISNPDGDFVQIPAFVANDSPTINISDDLGKIKNGAYLDPDLHATKSSQTSHLIEDEDEDLDTVNTKLDKFVVAGSIIAIVILAIAIIFIAVWFVDINTNKNGNGSTDITPTTAIQTPIPTETPTPTVIATGETYKMPFITSLTEADARASILAEDPKANIVPKEDYSDLYEKGYVMLQYPNAEADAIMGSTVIITISVGPQAFVIPYVYGLTEAQADKKLTEYGLIPKTEYAASDIIENGNVINTIPEKDSMVYKDDTVTVYVSTGPDNKQVIVPNLIGSTEEAATKLLTDLGLVKGSNVVYESSDTHEKGLVTYQSDTAGQLVDAGTSIDIAVSTGPVDVPADGTGTGIIIYVGSVTIDVDPFEYIGDGEAEFIFEMEQDGYTTNLVNENGDDTFMLSVTDFPFTLENIEGDGPSDGIVTMLMDGDPFILPGETEPKQWVVQFTAVEE